MARQVFKDFSASTVQVVMNQLLGLVIFYLTSKYLAKEIFGELNWSLATASLLVSIAGCGIDLMVVRKIAAGENVRETAGLFFIHALLSGTLLVSLLLLAKIAAPGISTSHLLLTGILASQVFTFFSSPFKQVANGKSLFRHLAVMSTIANIIKTLLLAGCLMAGRLTVENIVLIYVISSVAEFIAGLFLTAKHAGTSIFPLYWDYRKYISLIRESRHQFGVTVFNVVVARFDWFLLGILTTTVITAEYSFAYKVFELCRIPLLAISPVLIPLFIRKFNDPAGINPATLRNMNLLFRAEMVISVLLPLLLACCWSPLMDGLTGNKYGAVNETVFILLSICVPLQFATDYYWNMCFAQQQLRLTFSIAVVSSVVNIALNLLLIPLYGAKGAAIAYIACFAVQVVLFSVYTRQDKVRPNLVLLLKSMLCAAAALFAVKQLTANPVLAVLIAIPVYLLLAIITRLVEIKKMKSMVLVLLNRRGHEK